MDRRQVMIGGVAALATLATGATSSLAAMPADYRDIPLDQIIGMKWDNWTLDGNEMNICTLIIHTRDGRETRYSAYTADAAEFALKHLDFVMPYDIKNAVRARIIG